MGMGVRMAVDATYENIRQHILGLLSQATSYFDDLASTLIDVGQTYAEADSQYADRLRKIEGKL